MTFESIVRDIKSLKIQGATRTAKAAVEAIRLLSREHRGKRAVDIVHNLNKARKILFETRPTEPAMRNAINHILHEIELEANISSAIERRCLEAEKHFEEAVSKIAKFGSKKIKNGMVVFTHCHSTFVTAILKEAKKQGTRFEVHNTETRPMFQGRITARELAREGIPVTHYVDAAARLALKKADLMLIGADAITTEGKVINKIGSELFAELAEKFDIPVYSCADSWKFDPETVFGYEEEIEKRASREIWPTPPKGVKIDNHAFEKVDPELVLGIISELGIYQPTIFVTEVRRHYPWMF
jgi:ribose 1,5-bisphosphate isomerase